MTKGHLWGLALFYPVILLMPDVLKAQPKADVIIGAMVMQVDSEAAERLAASADTELRALARDPNTEIINRLQLRASDGKGVQLRIGDRAMVSVWT